MRTIDSYTLIALVCITAPFFVIGVTLFRRIRSLADFLPIARGTESRIDRDSDFSASTIATTISLATIVYAYLNLAQVFGLWLLWTAATGAVGMLVVYFAASRIQAKLAPYSHLPTINGYLAGEYKQNYLRRISGAAVLIGLMMLLATELLVGGRFLAHLIGLKQQSVVVAGIAILLIGYVCLGGFKAVVKTDRVQMLIMWALIPAFVIAVATFASMQEQSLFSLAENSIAFRPVDGQLVWFLVGVAAMNVPTHLCSISVWQRVAAVDSRRTLTHGLLRSSAGILISWSLLVLVAWAVTTATKANVAEDSMVHIISGIADSVPGRFIGSIVMMGLYSALLSTASSLLIAATHVWVVDVRSLPIYTTVPSTTYARISIVIIVIVACGVVVLLEQLQFSVADLVFSIYGGALSLAPSIILSLFKDTNYLVRIGTWASVSIVAGFTLGWGSALYGKLGGLPNLTFMSPAIGMGVSTLILGVAAIRIRHLDAGS